MSNEKRQKILVASQKFSEDVILAWALGVGGLEGDKLEREIMIGRNTRCGKKKQIGINPVCCQG